MKQDKIVFKAEKRKLLGKKVKGLRREGKIPANIFGRNFKSMAISINAHDFEKLYKKVGRTSVVYLDLEGKELPVLISQVQYHPLWGNPLHVDFKKVDLKKKVTAEVNVKVVGESPAVKEKGAEVLMQSHTLEVEALPDKIPHEIEVDISQIKEPGVEIKVKDLPKSSDYTILEDPEKTIVVISAHVAEEVPEAEASETEGDGEELAEKQSESKKEEETQSSE